MGCRELKPAVPTLHLLSTLAATTRHNRPYGRLPRPENPLIGVLFAIWRLVLYAPPAGIEPAAYPLGEGRSIP